MGRELTREDEDNAVLEDRVIHPKEAPIRLKAGAAIMALGSAASLFLGLQSALLVSLLISPGAVLFQTGWTRQWGCIFSMKWRIHGGAAREIPARLAGWANAKRRRNIAERYAAALLGYVLSLVLVYLSGNASPLADFWPLLALISALVAVSVVIEAYLAYQ